MPQQNKTQSQKVRDLGRPRVSRQISLPLYFGWEIVFRHVSNWSQFVIKPFKYYWQYMSVVILLIIAVSTYLFFSNELGTRAATYTWFQNNWSGGVLSTTATHTDDRTSWTAYSSKDATVAVGSDVTLSEITTTNTETSDTDFSAGTHSSSVTSGSGDSASVVISPAIESTPSLQDSETGLFYNAHNLKVSGDYLYVAVDDRGVEKYDITDPSNMIFKVRYLTGNDYQGVDVVGNYVYAVNGAGGLKLLEITGADTWTLVDEYNTPGSAYDVEVVGDYAYVADSGTVQILDISDPSGAGISFVGSYDPSLNVSEVYVNGNYLFTPIATAGVDIVDISNPAAPAYQGNYDTIGSATDVVVSGNYAFVADSTQGLVVLDISDPTDPTYVTNDSTYKPGDLHLDGSYIHARQSAVYIIYDISDPTSPTIETNIATGVGAAGDIYYSNGYTYLSASDAFYSYLSATYPASATFTSQAIDTNGASSWGNASWNATTPTDTAVTVKVRSDSNSDMSGATDWASCSTHTSGNDISSNACVNDGDRYIQYQVNLTTSDSTATPSFDDISIEDNAYTSGTLTSNKFDTEDATNVMSSVAWTETGTGSVKFQLRTSPDGETWTDYLGPSGTGDYYTDPAGETLNSSHTDGSGDRYFQYQMTIESVDGINTPTVTNVTATYVVNAPPEFESTVAASQNSDGTVAISYAIRDTDSTSGSSTPGYVTPSFEYSIDNGDTWSDITTGLSANATTSKAVDEASYTDYNLTWTAKDQIDGTYSETTKIRLTIDDNEGANNTASSASTAFTLDVKDPVAGSPSVRVIATTTPATVQFNATDDSSLIYCLDLTGEASGCTSYVAETSISLATDPDTVYVTFSDAFGNTTSDTAVTPQTPQNVIIRDISNVDSGSYRLFISWGAVSTPVDEFSNYRIWHSTDGSTYTLLDSIADKTVNYYLHDGLSVDSNHYYKIATEDNDGNVSYFSGVVNDEPNGQGGSDSTSPSISNVSVGSINTQSAVVTWDTDELSDSTVGYSTTAGNFDSEVGVATMVDSASGVGQHSVVLTGLTPNTTYYIQATSQDPDNNSSSDNNGGDGYSFTTLAGPEITNVSASTILNTSATITWTTDTASDSSVFYSANADLSGAIEVATADSVTSHEVELTGLSLGTKYYFYVSSGVAVDNNATDYYTFTTTSDGTAPIISGVTADTITDDEVVVIWTTSEAATSQVYFSTTTGAYTSSTAKLTSFNTSHSLSVKPLANDTTYYFVAVSYDASNNVSTSTEASFRTLETLSEESDVQTRIDEAVEDAETPVSQSCGGGGSGSRDTAIPILGSLTVDIGTDGTTTFKWSTNEYSSSFIEYGLTDDLGYIHGRWDSEDEHEVTLENLSPNTTYHYQAISTDAGGNIGRSSKGTFTTGNFDVGYEQPSQSDDGFIEGSQSTADWLRSVADQVSDEVLYQGLLSQQEAILEVSAYVPPPQISDPEISVSANNATIQWSTDRETLGSVLFATQDYYNRLQEYQYTVQDNKELIIDHQVELFGLEPETIYHYKIKSVCKLGVRAESRDYTFVTPAKEASIESYATEIIDPNTASFKWVTTVGTNSVVRYTPYFEGVLQTDQTRVERRSGITTIHDVTVDNLESGVIYEVELSGTDSRGNQIVQRIPAFATSDDNLPPIIEQVKTDSALSAGQDPKVQAIISWVTNEPATSRIYYARGVGSVDEELVESTPLDNNYSRKHVVVTTNFRPGTVYRFQVESIDIEGNVTRSRLYTILTPRQSESVFQIIIKNFEDTFGWLGVFDN